MSSLEERWIGESIIPQEESFLAIASSYGLEIENVSRSTNRNGMRSTYINIVGFATQVRISDHDGRNTDFCLNVIVHNASSDYSARYNEICETIINNIELQAERELQNVRNILALEINCNAAVSQADDDNLFENYQQFRTLEKKSRSRKTRRLFAEYFGELASTDAGMNFLRRAMNARVEG